MSSKKLKYHEIQMCKNYIFTDHAKERLDERFEFKDLTKRIRECRIGYRDNENKWHLYLNEGIEIVGLRVTNNFLIFTMFKESYVNFKRKEKLSIKYDQKEKTNI